MSEGSATSVSLGLSPLWEAVARKERDELDPRQAEKLLEYRLNGWSAGILFAWLHLIEMRRNELSLSMEEVAGRFDVSSVSVVVNWFHTGEISAAHFAQLIQQPEFRDIYPSEADASLHAYRGAVGWVYREVLGFKKPRRHLALPELFLLLHAHSLNCPDVDKMFPLLPEKLKATFPAYDHVWLIATFHRWGKAYRLAALLETEE